MAERQKQPPLQLEEEDVQPEGEGQGSLSYAGGGDTPGKKGFKVPSLGKKGPALGILQIFIPILAAVVIAFLLINAMAVNKGTYANGIAAVQTSVDTKIAAEDLKLSNVINNYASKAELSGFLKATDLSGYATSSALTTLDSKVTTLQASVGNQLTQAQIQALITTQLGSTSTYVTKAQMDAAIATAVIYLRGLIGSGSEGFSVDWSWSTPLSHKYLVMEGFDSGNYTGSVILSYSYGSSVSNSVDEITHSKAEAKTIFRSYIEDYIETVSDTYGVTYNYSDTVVDLDTASNSYYLSGFTLSIGGFTVPSDSSTKKFYAADLYDYFGEPDEILVSRVF